MSNKNGRSDLRSSTRDEEIRPQTNWTPPALLDAPQARPGFKQRWVATTILGKRYNKICRIKIQRKNSKYIKE